MKDLSALDRLITGRVEPHIYAFTTNTIPNYLKVGDTYRPVAKRLREWQEHFPNLEKKFEGSAKITEDVYFRDFSVHAFLEEDKHRVRLSPTALSDGIYYSKEFFRDTTAADIEEAISDINKDYQTKSGRYHYYDAATQLPSAEKYASTGFWSIRPNQQATVNAFKQAVANGRKHLLMYAVMRFGKSFTSMCCAKEMDAKIVVVVSAKADVRDEWRKTVESAENFRNDYEFFSSADLERNYNVITEVLNHPTAPKRVVVFLTLQDLQGEVIKAKHAQIFGRKIDLLLVDETHFGARAEKYGAVLRPSQGEKLSKEEKCTVEDILDSTKELDVNVTIHLSGTPYRILMSDEFDRDQDLIAFYQFTDIAREQAAWDRDNNLNDEPQEEWENPYFGFPQMIRFAFNPNESARKRMAALRESGLSDAFSALFKPRSICKSDDGSHKHFVHEQEILELLEVIDGSREDDELLGFLDYEKIKDGKMCRHIVVVLPYCASCDAFEALIRSNTAKFKNLNRYEIINISGVDNPNKYKKPSDIKRAISTCEAQGKKTITLTVNRMLTGSTVPEWDTMLFLKDTSSPQEYDQAIFRLQNQYIKEFISDDGKTIKFNMKPQTLLVDLDPDRVFVMQEQKAMVYNVNTEEAGNSKLRDRIEEELHISPIITMNKNRVVQINAANIMEAVSEYSKTRGVAEETVDIPVDMSLLDIPSIRMAVERENELGSKAGLTIKAAEGDGSDMDTPDDAESPDAPTDTTNTTDTTETGSPTNESAAPATTEENGKDIVKQFRSYYARILFFAFLTKNIVISTSEIIDCIDDADNARIAKNLSIGKIVLQEILEHADKFVLSRLDYKIQNLNQLAHDDSVDPVSRASIAVQKFGKLGESEVITPKHICKAMINMINDADLKNVMNNGGKILDIAGKAGEFALAICEKYFDLGYDIEAIKNAIYTIPTSGITYEFTRMIYEILGLNIDNIASGFTSYSLLGLKKEDGNIDYTQIAALLKQHKLFSKISMTDEPMEGDDILNFDVVVGNPPYQENIGGASNKSLSKQLFPSMIQIAVTLNPKHLTMITPSRWFTGNAQDRSFVKLREFLRENNHFRKITNYLSSADVFNGVNVPGGVNYFLFEPSYSGTVSFKEISQKGETCVERPLFEDGLEVVLPMNKMISILQKVRGAGFVSMEAIVTGRNPFGIPANDNDLNKEMVETRDATHGISILCAYEKMQFVRREIITRNSSLCDHWKVFTSKMNGGAGTLLDGKPVAILGKTFVMGPGSICSNTLLAVGDFDNQVEAINLNKYMNTKFFRFMLGIKKIAQVLTSNVYAFVPQQNFKNDSDILWANDLCEIDKQLYSKYKLTVEEIAFIETMIKPME